MGGGGERLQRDMVAGRKIADIQKERIRKTEIQREVGLNG